MTTPVTFLNNSGMMQEALIQANRYLAARAVPDGAMTVAAGVFNNVAGWSYPLKKWDGHTDEEYRTFRPLEVGDGPKFMNMAPGVQIYYTHPIEAFDALSVITLVESPIKAESFAAYTGRPCVAIYGCSMWRAAAGVAMLHQDLVRLRARNGEAKWEILFDGDIETNHNVKREAEYLSSALRVFNINHAFIKLPTFETGSGADDWVVDCRSKSIKPQDALKKLGATPVGTREPPLMAAARIGLQTKQKKDGGAEVPCNHTNLSRCYSLHEDWKDRLAYDEYRGALLDGKPVQEKTLFGSAIRWAESVIWYGSNVGQDKVRTALNDVIYNNRTNMLRDKLLALPVPESKDWDRELAVNCLGVEEEDLEDSIALIRSFGVAMISRILRPGSKFDGILILQGHEGLGKTWFFTRLLGDEYVSVVQGIKSVTDVYRIMRSSAVVIFDELVGFNKESMEEVWSMASETNIRFVDKFETHPTEFKAHSVIVGTTAKPQWDYSRSNEGARRYMVVRCRGAVIRDGSLRFNLAWLDENRDAILAHWRELMLADFPYWEYEEQGKRLRQPSRIENPMVERLLGAIQAGHLAPLTKELSKQKCIVASATQLLMAIGESRPTKIQANEMGAAIRELGGAYRRVWDDARVKKEDKYVLPLFNIGLG